MAMAANAPMLTKAAHGRRTARGGHPADGTGGGRDRRAADRWRRSSRAWCARPKRRSRGSARRQKDSGARARRAMSDEPTSSSTRQRGRAALVTMNRPRYRNAQNAKMTFALDEAFVRAVKDDAVKVIVLAGAGDALLGGARHRHAGARHPQVLRARGHDVVGARGQGRRREPLRARAGALPRACAGAGASCRSPPSRWSRARASPAG